MNRCFKIYEIITIILQFLDADDQSSPGLPRYVNRVGQTCRMLFDPAMDVLWSTQTTLFNLIKCLPSDLLHIARSKDEDGSILLSLVGCLDLRI